MREIATVLVDTLACHAEPGSKNVVGYLKKGQSFTVMSREGPPQHKLVWYSGRHREILAPEFWCCHIDAKGNRCLDIKADQYVPPTVIIADEPADDEQAERPWLWIAGGSALVALLLWLALHWG
jgi:hypothetical protein